MEANAAPVRPLPELAVLRVGGRDAASFLQGQLTNDVRLLADGRTQLTAFTTPQGRVIALLRLRQDGDVIHALLPSELAQPVTDRLSRFVLRAKVKLEVRPDLHVAWVRTDGNLSPPAGAVSFDYSPRRRALAATAEDWAAALGQGLADASAASAEWTAADVADGLPQVLGASSEAFVPQMLNMDLIDGISFKKGCYTGQEIVARTQHLGRIKRRTFRYLLAPGRAPAPLAGLFRNGVKVAEVVVSATVEDGVDVLAVTALEARGQVLQAEDGRNAEPRALPYEV